MAFLDEKGLRRFFAGLKERFVKKEQVINHLVMEEEGGVLDARQGKALDEKKAETFEMSLTIPCAGWEDDGEGFAQTIDAEGLLDEDMPFVCLDLTGMDAETFAETLGQWQRVNRMVCSLNSLTAYCCGTRAPEADLNIRVKVVR